MQTKLAMAVLFGFVLVAAAACSRSSDRDRIAQLESDLATSEEARQEAEQEAADARQRADDAEEEAADALQEAADAEQEVADAEQEAADAEQEAADAQQRADDAEEAQRQAQQQQQQLQQQLTEAEQAELRARASSFGTQLDFGDGTTGPTAPTSVSAPATISWTRGNMRTFRPSGVTFASGSAAPSVPGGWSSASFTGQTGTADALINDTVYLYTNIQPPSSRNFWKVHNVEVANAHGVAADNPTPTGTPRVVRVGSDPLDHGDAATFDIAVSGTYDGVSGTYTCAACTIDESDGDITDITAADFEANDYVTGTGSDREFVSGTEWSFKPDSIYTRVKIEDQADQDDAYLYFGIWSSIPDDIVGTYNFRYIAGGGAGPASGLTNFNALTGPVTFRGGAVGRYTTQGQVGGQNAKIGTFTATATLNAHFGTAPDDGTADTAPGTLSGSITDFREGGNPLAGWRVTLGGGGSPQDVGMPMAISNGAVTGGITVANIGGLSVAGSWGATFYGSDNEVLEDRIKYPAKQHPVVDLAGVAGWFDATGTGVNDASLAGAFAATPQ